ncbi:MAG: PilZ domain-containing protein [Nitrospirota bacterium]
MSRRTSWRIPISVNIKCYSGDKESPGTVTNLSEKGMFINTEETSCPEDSQFQVTIPAKEDDLHLSVKLIRSVKTNSHYGLGVELLNPPQKYTEYVDNLLHYFSI